MEYLLLTVRHFCQNLVDKYLFKEQVTKITLIEVDTNY